MFPVTDSPRSKSFDVEPKREPKRKAQPRLAVPRGANNDVHKTKNNADTSFCVDKMTLMHIFLLAAIFPCLYFKYNGMSYIGKAEMFATVSCIIQKENELVCRVYMQNASPTSVEECGKNGSHFCGTLCQHVPSPGQTESPPQKS